MAVYTKKEFASEAGISEQHLNVDIGKGKVVLNLDGEVDTDSEENNTYLQKKLARPAKPKFSSSIKKAREAAAGMQQISLTQVAEFDWAGSMKRKEAADLEKKELDNEILRIKRDKLLNELISANLVKDLVTNYTEHLKSAYLEASDNMIIFICESAELAAEFMAKSRAKNIELINKAIRQAAENFRKELSDATKEIEEQRGKGERKPA